MSNLLFSPTKLAQTELSNRVVMAPMTRSRAIGNIPNALMAEYYRQRAGAGLIITEGTSPSPNGLGYPRIPGIFSAEQVAGWRLVTDAVHAAGGKIVVQLMHTGRVSAIKNLPEGAEVLAPSATLAPGLMWTDSDGQQPHDMPRAMNKADIVAAIAEYATAAKNAVEAGFDGIELHGANGYLLEQFLRPCTNLREDEYGGTKEGRSRFVLEVIEACKAAIGGEKVGIRLSPFGMFNGMVDHPEQEPDYAYLVEKINETGIGYVHLLDHSGMGAPPVPASVFETFRQLFKGTIILCGDYNAKTAEAALESGKGDLIAFGRPFIANPNLVERFQKGLALSQPDATTFYTPGEKGYTDYAV